MPRKRPYVKRRSPINAKDDRPAYFKWYYKNVTKKNNPPKKRKGK